jgi:tRNA threonylcarbamoyladenosine modification (KEOPS) complex  Pcc1 subunit
MNELVVRLQIPQEAAEACLNSIKPEVESDIHERSSVELKYDGELILRITAGDLHALRAAANTYIRWLDMCLKLVK